MKKIALSVVGLVLAGMSSVSLATPVEMTENQMDQVSAGALVNIALVDLVDLNLGVATATNVAVLSAGIIQQALAGNSQGNWSGNWVNQQ